MENHDRLCLKGSDTFKKNRTRGTARFIINDATILADGGEVFIDTSEISF